MADHKPCGSAATAGAPVTSGIGAPVDGSTNSVIIGRPSESDIFVSFEWTTCTRSFDSNAETLWSVLFRKNLIFVLSGLEQQNSLRLCRRTLRYGSALP